VNRFAQTTMTEFREAVQTMGAIDGLVLDLRGNGGGYLGMAIEMGNFFLDSGDMIVSTEGMRMRGQEHRATRNGDFRRGRVVVLIDELSASASEIVAGALQDWDRAVIVGRRSCGKGLVQQQFPLQDGSAIRITVAQYLTPAGRAIQRPFEMGHSDEYHQELARRIAAGEDMDANDMAQPAFKTLRLGRTVYGGGGISPDYFVAADTDGVSDYLVRLSRMGILGEFLVNYLDRNRTALVARYPTFEAFDSGFSVGDDILGEVVALAEQRGISPDPEGLAESRDFLSTQLKALIAGRLWTNSEFFRVVNSRRDPVYQKALEIMSDWDRMAAGIAMDR
jgi:carboxyl-terminal processing protease